MTTNKPLFDLKATPKPEHVQDRENDKWGRSVERKKPGRKKTKRTAQLHPRLYPQIADEITQIAEDREITVGVLIEEMFQVWKINQK